MLSIIMKATRREKFEQVTAAAKKMRPRIRKAFKAALAVTKKDINLKALEAALTGGDIEAAISLVNVDNLENILKGAGLDVDVKSFKEEIIVAFSSGATVGISQLPKRVAIEMSFDIFNPRAVQWAETRTGTLIRQITNKTKAGVRELITTSVSEGVSPRKTARSIRELVGLTEKQARAVANFREQLEAQSNLGMRAAFNRRLSGAEKAIVRRHLKEGNLDQAGINKLVARYNQSLINKRALDIARTESINAVQAGQLEAWRQAQDQGLLPVDVKRIWIVTPDDRLREDHAAIPGMNPEGVGLSEEFQTPFGPVIGPHDSDVHLINCRCATILTNLE